MISLNVFATPVVVLGWSIPTPVYLAALLFILVLMGLMGSLAYSGLLWILDRMSIRVRATHGMDQIGASKSPSLMGKRE
ncbi:MAG: hypothetical protein E2591_27295 [Achromobacter sp.]|nr:hypothetical protein [Achromobacter sp.]